MKSYLNKPARWIALLILGFFPLFIGAEPLYHPNGRLATTGDFSSSFYHDNNQLAWFGPQNKADKSFYYRNGAVAWKGSFNRETFFSYDLCTVFHSNGKIAWKGCSNRDVSFSYDPCSIYHDNGKLAWKGALNKDVSFSYDPCTLYHNNGKVLWRGAKAKEVSFSYDPCTIYHSNGVPAWRGEFSSDGSSGNSIALYCDNGKLAWSGRQGDPIYDCDGTIIENSAEALYLPIGEGSWLYVSWSGHCYIHLNIGGDSFLTFSNQDNNPCLQMNLGSGYKLEFFPYTGDMPQLNVYEYVIPVRKI